MAKPKPFPKGMGACADLLHEKRSARLAADKVAAALKDEEQALIEHIINNLPKDSGGAIGKAYKVTVVTKEKPQVKDWPLFYAYVLKNKAFDLLQRRLSDTAIAERIADKRKVPGVEMFNATTVSLTKK